MQLFGLVGKNISYSFSRAYFADKFSRLGINAQYLNFDIPEIGGIESFIGNPNLRGFNVTIPYKQQIMSYLDRVSVDATQIGAVNTVRIEDDGTLSGHNTDWIGFTESLRPMLQHQDYHALIMGSGGASLAVAYALDRLGIGHQTVSRSGPLQYGDLDRSLWKSPLVAVNATPVGTYPDIDESPLRQDFLMPGDIAFDLIYNPPQTRFLQDAKNAGATTLNGQRMLEIQAEKAWEIWTGDAPA